MKDDVPDRDQSMTLLEKQRLALAGSDPFAPKSGEALLLQSSAYRHAHTDWSRYGDNIVTLERITSSHPEPPKAA